MPARAKRSDAGVVRPARRMSVVPRDRDAVSYLAGVLAGDGYVTKDGRRLGLHVKDEDFVRAFALALNNAFAAVVQPFRDDGYWRVTCSRASGFSWLHEWNPSGAREAGLWLRGFFDSEGSVSLIPQAHLSPGAMWRKVAMYSAEPSTIDKAQHLLRGLGIDTVVTSRAGTAAKATGHFGMKRIYELRVRCSKEGYARFAEAVGSSIGRKQEILQRLAPSYKDRLSFCSLGGQRGCASRWGARTHCARGHDLSLKGAWVVRRDTGRRQCRLCVRDRDRKRKRVQQ